MTIKHIITLLVLTITANTFAQNKGKVLLQEVSEKVKRYGNISIDFKYTLENLSENIKQETRGDVVMQGDKYKLNILGVTRLFDGNKLYTISPEDEEVTISTEGEDEDDSVTPKQNTVFL